MTSNELQCCYLYLNALQRQKQEFWCEIRCNLYVYMYFFLCRVSIDDKKKDLSLSQECFLSISSSVFAFSSVLSLHSALGGATGSSLWRADRQLPVLKRSGGFDSSCSLCEKTQHRAFVTETYGTFRQRLSEMEFYQGTEAELVWLGVCVCVCSLIWLDSVCLL